MKHDFKKWVNGLLLVIGILSSTTAFSQATQGLESADTVDASREYALSELLNAAIFKNPAMRGKQSEIEAKGYLSDSARAARYPSASLQAGYVNSHYNNATHNENILSLQVRQPLWAFGKIDDGIAYADMDVSANEADLIRISRELLDKTVVAYTQLVSVKQRQKVLKNNVETLKALYRQIQSRHQGQIASKADVDLAFLRLIQARSEQNKVDGELLLAITEIQALTQLPVEKVVSATPGLIVLPDDSAEIVDLAIEKSADVHYKIRLYDLAKANTTKQSSSMMPTIYLQANKELNDLYSSNGEQIGIMLDASLDGMGFSHVGLSKAAKASELASKEGVNIARNELIRQVKNLLHSRTTQGQMTQVIEQSVDSFQTILDSYIRQYEAGKKNWLDVLNIQREMTSTRIELVDVNTEWYRASLKLMVLIGKLDVVS